MALPARNLALAEAQGFGTVVAPCAACFNRLSAARLAVAKEPGMAERIPDVLGRAFANSVEVQSVIQLLLAHADAITQMVAEAPAPNPLGGLHLASYYGCLLVRPAEVCASTTPRRPRPWTVWSRRAAPRPSTGT